MQNLKNASFLAGILKNSNVKEVSALAEGFQALEASYKELLHAYTKQTGEIVMKKHSKLLKRLAEFEKGES